jgi:hypothetical protein
LGERDRVRAGQPSRPEPAPPSNPQSSQSLLTSAPTTAVGFLSFLHKWAGS